MNDTQRLDWLEKMVVNVRTPLVYGSRDTFWSGPDEDDNPSDLRQKIDQCAANFAKTGKKLNPRSASAIAVTSTVKPNGARASGGKCASAVRFAKGS